MRLHLEAFVKAADFILSGEMEPAGTQSDLPAGTPNMATITPIPNAFNGQSNVAGTESAESNGILEDGEKAAEDAATPTTPAPLNTASAAPTAQPPTAPDVRAVRSTTQLSGTEVPQRPSTQNPPNQVRQL